MNLKASINVNEQCFDLIELDEYGCETSTPLSAAPSQNQGILSFDGQNLKVDFRVRSSNEETSTCTFSGLPLSSQQKIRKYIDILRRIGEAGILEEKSYDELARGIDAANVETGNEANATVSQRSALFKSAAMLVMIFALVGLFVLGVLFLRSRSSLKINNASLTGNFLPVNARATGEIDDLLVVEGQHVRKGDLLLRLKNPEIESLQISSRAARETAKLKVQALRKQLSSYQRKLTLASQKLTLDWDVSNSELEVATKTRNAAQARSNRMLPFVESGAITDLEYNEVQEELLAAESLVIAAKSQLRQIEFSRKAMQKDILILGDRIDDELGRITAELEIAEAELKELDVVCSEAAKQFAQLEIVAPRDGKIYSTYRHRGEFLQVADEVVAISYTGTTWAAGHVTPDQASRVRPGQQVKISFTSLGMTLDGVVLAVGHRSMYSKGRYNADFRGTAATDVPIKVRIYNLPDDVPSGIRVEMAVNTGFGIDWLDKLTGFELKPVWDKGQDFNARPVASNDIQKAPTKNLN